jgi:N-acetylglucosamine kinase
MILCVDGGSTKTIAVVFDENKLDIIGVGLSGSANYTTNSPVMAKKEIKKSINEALEQAKLTINDIDRRVIAVVGIGDSEESTKVGNGIMEEVVGHNFEVMNDGKSAYYLGNLENNGFVFAPGTGSVGYIRRSEEMERVGGWGWMLGDFSSATWIVKKGIEAAMFENDTGEENQLISENLKTYFGSDVRELVWKVETRNIQKNILAGFAVILSELAKKGYYPAINVFKQSADYITLLGNRIMEKFGSSGQVALVGGTMLSGDFYMDMLRSGLKYKFHTYYGYQVVLGSLMGKLNLLKPDIRDNLIKQLDHALFMLPEDKLIKYLKISSPPKK